jgi:hypothetical protein
MKNAKRSGMRERVGEEHRMDVGKSGGGLGSV